jgi:hypothetical protein
MNLSIRPILLACTSALGLVLVASPTRVHAFGGPPGGPFGNGSYFPNDGTFSAVVRGTNLTGTLQFSTTAGAGTEGQTVLAAGDGRQELADVRGGVGSTGVAVIYYNGDTYLGDSQGSLNPADSSMTVSFQAGAPGQGEQSFQVVTPIETSETTNVLNPLTGEVIPVETTQTQFVPTIEVRYFDSLYLNGFAECKTSNAFPNQKFKGKGEAEFQHLVFTGFTPFLDAVSMPISVEGVRLSNTASSFASRNVRSPSVSQVSVLIP